MHQRRERNNKLEIKSPPDIWRARNVQEMLITTEAAMWFLLAVQEKFISSTGAFKWDYLIPNAGQAFRGVAIADIEKAKENGDAKFKKYLKNTT